jgi:hypothetical protein
MAPAWEKLIDSYKAEIAALERETERLRTEKKRLADALIPFAFIGRASLEPLGLADEYDEARRVLGL